MRFLAATMVAGVVLSTAPRSTFAAKLVAERTVARFQDPEASDASMAQRFVFERELLIEAWLVAYERAPLSAAPTAYDDKSLRAALDRHLIDEVLATRPLPPKHEARVLAATLVARKVIEDSVGGAERLNAALTGAFGRKVTAPEVAELDIIVRRRARAEIWLEVAVAPPIEPTLVELAAFHPKTPELIAKAPFDAERVRPHARAARLREFANTYLQLIRSKLQLEILE